ATFLIYDFDRPIFINIEQFWFVGPNFIKYLRNLRLVLLSHVDAIAIGNLFMPVNQVEIVARHENLRAEPELAVKMLADLRYKILENYAPHQLSSKSSN